MSPQRRLVAMVIVSFGVLGVGTVGYRAIEGWPWLDALYHTVITLSTVGYAEVHPLSLPGRLFTMVLILASLALLALAVHNLTRLVIEGELRELVWRRRMTKDLSRVTHHVVVCGFGTMGRLVAEELQHAGRPFVVVEKDAERVREAVTEGHLVVEGDATSDEVLTAAGVDRAEAAVCTLPSDADNVFATLSLRVLSPQIEIISRYDEEETREKLLRAGADHAVSPKLMGGLRVANHVLRPAATQFLDQAVRGRELELRLAEFSIAAGSGLAGLPLSVLPLRERFATLLVAIRRADGTWLPAPAPHDRLETGDTAVVLGKPAGVDALLAQEAAR